MNLTRIVEQHDQIIQYVNTINSYYYVCYTIQAPFAVLMLSSLLVNIVSNMKNYESFNGLVLCAAYFSGIMSNLFFICITGQELINASSNVFRQMYCGKWNDASISNQKTLLLIMCKCMRPAVVSFASLFTVSSELCASVLNASMSYFTVFYSLQ
ncbi:odorant receptor 10-like isoform X1 [Halictus rubicundus]|uniref:odorant receptor 10-like isoform X1 n=1 Tax=Halictus rubicundus TaxID=77578 RepID=UPI00403756CE